MLSAEKPRGTGGNDMCRCLELEGFAFYLLARFRLSELSVEFSWWDS